jgi:hypothetical protein
MRAFCEVVNVFKEYLYRERNTEGTAEAKLDTYVGVEEGHMASILRMHPCSDCSQCVAVITVSASLL